MWIWIVLCLGGFLSLVLLAALVGWLLPKEHQASKTIQLPCTPDEVWKVINDFASQPTWRSDVAKVELLTDADGMELWKETDQRGESVPYRTIKAVPPTLLVRKIADPKLPFGGTWTFRLLPKNNGCELTITEDGEVYQPIFRLVSKLMDMSATIDRYLESLRKRLA